MDTQVDVREEEGKEGEEVREEEVEKGEGEVEVNGVGEVAEAVEERRMGEGKAFALL